MTVRGVYWPFLSRLAFGTKGSRQAVISLPFAGLHPRKDISMKIADHHMPPRPFAPARRHLGATALASGALIAGVALAATGCSSVQGAHDSLALAGATTVKGLSSVVAGSYQIVK